MSCTVSEPSNLSKKGEALRTKRSGHVLRVIMFNSLRAFSLIALMLMAPLAGCFGENEKESLKRELKEELDISVSIDDYITESFYEYDKAKINLKAYFVKNYSGTIKLTDHDKINWIKIDELNNYEFAPADIPINNYLIKNGL